MTDRLTLRQLNRALLDRQGLLERRTGSALAMIDHLVGMQSQSPSPLMSACGHVYRASNPTN